MTFAHGICRRYKFFLFIALFIFTVHLSIFGQVKSKLAMKHEDVSGFCNLIELSGGKGMGHTSKDYTGYFVGVNDVLGYVINHHFIIGLGVGASAYNGGFLIPAYMDVRYRFRERKFTPYLFGDGGLLFNIDKLMDYSLFLNPGVGVIKKIGPHFALNIGIGLFEQSVPDNSSFVNFKFGITYLSNCGDDCRQGGRK